MLSGAGARLRGEGGKVMIFIFSRFWGLVVSGFRGLGDLVSHSSNPCPCNRKPTQLFCRLRQVVLV